MELQQLRSFAAVARHGHFTRAAADLHIGQPAVSQHIRRLEAELGVRLLRRTTRSVELTEAGAILLARSERALGELEAAQAELAELKGLVRGRLTIGAMQWLEPYDLPGALASFHERHPAIDIRVVLARFGIVLARNGGALPAMMLPFRFFAGGKIGSGRQWMSWISLEDVVEISRLAIETGNVRGPINVISPQPVQNAEFTKTLASAMHRPAFFPAPAFALRLALGEMADALLLSSQRVLPQRLQKLGYNFQYADLSAALKNVLKQNSKP